MTSFNPHNNLTREKGLGLLASSYSDKMEAHSSEMTLPRSYTHTVQFLTILLKYMGELGPIQCPTIFLDFTQR